MGGDRVELADSLLDAPQDVYDWTLDGEDSILAEETPDVDE